ncbi:MAG: protease HtpX [Thioalkalivibrio sp.]
MTRIFLFLATNVAILLVLSIAMKVFGVESMLADTGMNVTGMLIIAGVIGFGGSFISLAISKWMAKKTMKVHVIDKPRNRTEQWLVETVKRQAREAGIGMPEVGVFDSPDPNAFATGMSKNNALVAVSTGLIERMNGDEVEAVLGHEIAHVANGDMVTLALIQGVVNTFVIFLARAIGYFVDRVVFKNERGHGPGFWITTIVAQMLLAILASIIVMWFSRWREFRADAGGARFSSREKMIAALEKLRAVNQPTDMPDQMAAFGIRGGLGVGMKKLFMTHPPLEDRIMALKAMPR